MKVLISGGTGFIGRALVPRLIEYGHEPVVWSRSYQKARQALGDDIPVITSLDEIADDEIIHAVINLAGAGIADQRWSQKRKALLRSSRIDTTVALVSLIRRLAHKPGILISGSAIGFYGCWEDDRPLAESSDVRQGFTHQLCADWERAALDAEADGVRVCLIRTGVVLGKGGGALAKMLPPFRLGLGGPVASGEQWMSWIHMDDEIEIICMMLTHEHFSGAYNLTAPGAVNNADFSQQLATTLHRPAWFRVPGCMLNLMLGEGSELLVKGQRVVPERLLEAGYKFAFPNLDSALNQVLGPAD